MHCKSLAIVVLCLLSVSARADEEHPGRVNYMLQCQGCHKANGGGIENSVPDLRTYGRALLLTDAGRRYYVVVPGSANAPLTDSQLADVLNYIISAILKDNGSGTNSLRRYDAKEIARYRHVRENNVDELRQELISRIAK